MFMDKLTKLRGESSRQLAHYFYCPIKASLGLLVSYRKFCKDPWLIFESQPSLSQGKITALSALYEQGIKWIGNI